MEDELSSVPASVIEKHNWCNQTYADETLLFVMDGIA